MSTNAQKQNIKEIIYALTFPNKDWSGLSLNMELNPGFGISKYIACAILEIGPRQNSVQLFKSTISWYLDRHFRISLWLTHCYLDSGSTHHFRTYCMSHQYYSALSRRHQYNHVTSYVFIQYHIALSQHLHSPVVTFIIQVLHAWFSTLQHRLFLSCVWFRIVKYSCIGVCVCVCLCWTSVTELYN